MLDKPGVSVALWSARKPYHLDATVDLWDWSLDESAIQAIEKIVEDTISDPISLTFMRPEIRAA